MGATADSGERTTWTPRVGGCVARLTLVTKTRTKITALTMTDNVVGAKKPKPMLLLRQDDDDDDDDEEYDVRNDESVAGSSSSDEQVFL